MLLQKELRSFIQIEVLRNHRHPVGRILLRVKQHIGKVIILQRGFCVGGINQETLVRVLQFQHPFGGELCVRFHAVDRHIGDVQLLYLIFKAGRFIVPEHQFAVLARRKHNPKAIFYLAQCRFSHAGSSFLYLVV